MQGKSINGFTLQHLLGTGGMAEVWLAESKIGMKAAVKILSEKLSHDDQMQERFLNEAKVMVKLDHPNIRKVHGYGSIDGRPAIIMEYLDGSDLKKRMKDGQRFTQEKLVKWWNQLVDALNYTHAQNIVHRDIKPSNIFIDQKGNAKLLDFGIAKVADTTTGTLTGSTLGTRIYMSPEQVKDPKRVGTASDVYSLAVSFVHLLTGKALYDSTTSSDYDIQVSIVTKPVDLSEVPASWQGFLAPYLAKKPEDRPSLKPFETVASEALDKMGEPDDEGTIVGVAEKKRESKKFEPKRVEKPRPKKEGKSSKKKGLWIGLGLGLAAVAVAFIVILMRLNLVVVMTGSDNGHEWVDLGLPSGTLWATCNIGATSPEGCGNYYAWGEKSTKSIYNWNTYKYAKGAANKLTKYINSSSFGNYGFTDNLIQLQTVDDPAVSAWGGGWRTPSKAQWNEMLAYTTIEKTVQNGVEGMLFTSKKNKQTLFLPAAGDRWDGKLYYVGSRGYYWSGSFNADNSREAWGLYFESYTFSMNSYYRYYGFNVRPIREKYPHSFLSTFNITMANSITKAAAHCTGEYLVPLTK